MTDLDLNKRLHEIMGMCFHEQIQNCIVDYGRVIQPAKCSCGHTSLLSTQACSTKNIDFLTWEGFGVLWEWLQKQELWWTFCNKYGDVCNQDKYMKIELINPRALAEAVVKFFGEEKK